MSDRELFEPYKPQFLEEVIQPFVLKSIICLLLTSDYTYPREIAKYLKKFYNFRTKEQTLRKTVSNVVKEMINENILEKLPSIRGNIIAVRLIQKQPDLLPDDERFIIYRNWGFKSDINGQHSEAFESYLEALLYRDDEILFHCLEQLWVNEIDKKDTELARKLSRSMYKIGEYYLDRDDYTIAIKLYEFAKTINPKHLCAHLKLMVAYMLAKDYIRAIEVAKESLEICNDTLVSQINFSLGTFYYQTCDYKIAIESFERAKEGFSQENQTERVADCLMCISIMNYKLGNQREEEIYYKRALKIYKKLHKNDCLDCIISYKCRGWEIYEKGIELLSDYINCQKKQSCYYKQCVCLAFCFENSGEREKAIIYYNEALEHGYPNDGFIRDRLNILISE